MIDTDVDIDVDAIRSVILDGVNRSTGSIPLQCKVPDRILERLKDALSDFRSAKLDDLEYAMVTLEEVFDKVYDDVDTMREACSDLREIAVARGKALREIDGLLP